jgi:hypothetical protein
MKKIVILVLLGSLLPAQLGLAGCGLGEIKHDAGRMAEITCEYRLLHAQIMQARFSGLDADGLETVDSKMKELKGQIRELVDELTPKYQSRWEVEQYNKHLAKILESCGGGN